ncbi:MAG: hypothetical protein IV100_13805 [Myxococcales bacterium]|nr:hypothetical protein [Myxococcales bacterium]
MSDFKRPISGEIATKRLLVSCTATCEQRAHRRAQRTLSTVSCVMTNTPAGIAVKALSVSCSDGVSAKQKGKRLLTDSDLTRVSSAMLSETAISR